MPESFAKTIFPSLYTKLEKEKQSARSKPLTMAAINTLLAMRFNNKPLFPSIELFYSEEYRDALQKGVSPAELEKIETFRLPAENELNQLYCDIHARDDMAQYSSSGNQSDT